MIYDVAIIGAGVSGCSTAWHLSHQELKVVLIDKECDSGFGITKANSGIVHGGFHHPVTSLKAKLEVEAIPMFDKMKEELDFPYEKCGIIVAAFNEEQIETCKKLFAQGHANGVDTLKWCSKEELLAMEPKLSPDTCGGFFAPEGGVIEPYAYAFRMASSAKLNGVDLCYDSKITKGEFNDGLWTLHIAGSDRVIKSRYVVNAAGLYADEVSRCCNAENFTITPRKGEEYLLDRNSAGRPNHVIFPVPSKHSKGVLVIPTVGGTTMIGPNAQMIEDKSDTATNADTFKNILQLVKPMISGITERDCITSFAGLRPVMEGEDFYIAPSELVPNFIQAAGIQSPGLTASPAVGKYIMKLLSDAGLAMTPKKGERKMLPPRHEVRNLTTAEVSALHDGCAEYTEFVCRCEKITRAEIVEAVRLGHTTLDGVKFYTRAGMGRCQGGFCAAKIMKIISETSGIPLEELTKRGGESKLIAGRLGALEVKGE